MWSSGSWPKTKCIFLGFCCLAIGLNTYTNICTYIQMFVNGFTTGIGNSSPWGSPCWHYFHLSKTHSWLTTWFWCVQLIRTCKSKQGRLEYTQECRIWGLELLIPDLQRPSKAYYWLPMTFCSITQHFPSDYPYFKRTVNADSSPL